MDAALNRSCQKPNQSTLKSLIQQIVTDELTTTEKCAQSLHDQSRKREIDNNYFNQLVNLLFTDGGLFSPPPQNPDTNIRRVRGEDRAEGYFLVSPIITQLVFIDEEPDSD